MVFIRTIYADGEFHWLTYMIQNGMNVSVNVANPDDHVPEAERNNRTNGERIRAGYHQLPYESIPRKMIQSLVMAETKNLFIWPIMDHPT